MAQLLTDRALNRALLARQGLLEPWDCTALEAVHRLVGLQAQSPTAPYFGLHSRLPSFRPTELAEAMLDRTVVRIAMMRGTLHLVTAADCLTLRPTLDPHLLRTVLTGGRLAAVDLDRLRTVAEAAWPSDPAPSRSWARRWRPSSRPCRSMT